MRNLELLLASHISGLSELERCHSVSVDYDTGHIYIATKEGNIICLDPQTEEVTNYNNNTNIPTFL